jgi:tripartite ATP-independent transporter DctM subunit
MIIYGAFTGHSVGRLFAAGIIPGLLLASTFLLLIIISVKVRPELAPQKPQGYSWKERLISLGELIPSFLLIFIVLGGIFGGVVTPTEAAAVGCVGAALIALAYRMLTWKIIWMSAESALRTVSMIMLVAVFARVLSFLLQYLGLGEMFSNIIIDADLGKYGTLALIFGMYLILGMFFEGLSMMILTLPFVMPIIYALGLSGYWFAVPLVIMVEASLISPPVGLNLYVLQSLSPEHDVLEVALGALPFFIPMLIVVAIVSVYPQIVTWLPGIIYH